MSLLGGRGGEEGCSLRAEVAPKRATAVKRVLVYILLMVMTKFCSIDLEGRRSEWIDLYEKLYKQKLK